MGFPDPKDYYVAVILDQIRHWIMPTFHGQRRKIQQTLIPNGDLATLLLAQSVPNTLPATDHPTISAAVSIWKLLLRDISTEPSNIAIPTPLEIFKFIIPNMSLVQWSSLRRTPLTALVQNVKLLPFSTLQAKYNLSSLGLFFYRQMASYFHKNSIPIACVPKKAWAFWSSDVQQTKGIRLFYNLLQAKDKFTKDAALEMGARLKSLILRLTMDSSYSLQPKFLKMHQLLGAVPETTPQVVLNSHPNV